MPVSSTRLRSYLCAVAIAGSPACAREGTPKAAPPEEISVLARSPSCDETQLSRPVRLERALENAGVRVNRIRQIPAELPQRGPRSFAVAPVDELLANARMLLARGNLTSARTLALEAEKRAMEGRPLAPAWERLVDAEQVLTQIELQRGVGYDAAALLLSEVLAVNPAQPLPALEKDPRVDWLNRLRDEFALRPTGTLEVHSGSVSSHVYVNGFPLGTTPARLPLPEGLYTVSVGTSAEQAWTWASVEIKQGQVTRRTADLADLNRIEPRTLPCIRSAAALTDSDWLELGALLGAKRLVAVGSDSARAPLSLRVYDVPGKRNVRAIELLLDDDAQFTEKDLVAFIRTGQVDDRLARAQQGVHSREVPDDPSPSGREE